MRGAILEHQLILDLPSDIYEPLSQTAKRRKLTLEKLAIEWLATAVHQIEDDPLEPFIGALASNNPNWADQHDRYLGLSVAHSNTDENN